MDASRPDLDFHLLNLQNYFTNYFTYSSQSVTIGTWITQLSQNLSSGNGCTILTISLANALDAIVRRLLLIQNQTSLAAICALAATTCSPGL
jgi:hypothetical protein